MSTVRAPGKLLIVGEYSVVRTGRPAVVIAMDAGIRAEARALSTAPGSRPATGLGALVASSAFADSPLTWTPAPLNAPAADRAAREPALRALDVLAAYAHGAGAAPTPLDITLTSSLADDAGTKYGLGSSGAVVVAVVAAAADAWGLDLEPDTLFRVSALAVIAGSPSASCADVAASVLGGWIFFRSFDRAAVLERAQSDGVHAAVHAPWPGLELRPLHVSERLRVLVGWSGSPASTANLVAALDEAAATGAMDLEEWAERSEAATLALARDLEAGDIAGVLDGIRASQRLLADLDHGARGDGRALGILTPALGRMIDIAEAHGAAAKISGAGGGDCMIALTDRDEVSTRVQQTWRSEGFTPLDLGLGALLVTTTHPAPAFEEEHR
ncbi:MAG: phosphomevalonate kinase [Dermabacter sp.]|nr:phosphomevalonate kinase [Dermabacter sp.]